jgi:hypothetical protein
MGCGRKECAVTDTICCPMCGELPAYWGTSATHNFPPVYVGFQGGEASANVIFNTPLCTRCGRILIRKLAEKLGKV